MKTKILTVLCAVLTVCCIVLTVCVVSLKNDNEGPTTPPALAGSTSQDIQFKLALLHIYNESLVLSSTLPYATIQITYASLVKAFVTDPDSVSAAVEYLNKHVDMQVLSAYDRMEDITKKYKSVLTKYNISSSSPYTAKYNTLVSTFASLKNSSSELISRTRSLIMVSQSNNYDSSYTLYIEQLSDLTNKITSAVVAFTNEYEALLESVSNDYDILK